MNSRQLLSSSSLFYFLVIFLTTTIAVCASYDGNTTDHLALLSFKSMITRDPFGVMASWNSSTHFCDWFGVWCGRKHKRVIIIGLDGQGLEGSLSPHAGNLSFLRMLSLDNNSFQGTIPPELGRLSKLRSLYLYQNKFTGVIPSNLSACSNLKDLWLGHNKLVGSIPKEISFLSKLRYVVLQDNNLTGGLPRFLGNITSMKEFSAAGNPFGGSIPNTLGYLNNLTLFYCDDCNLYGTIPHSLFNLSLLSNLSLPRNHLTGSLPLAIGEMLHNLVLFQLDYNQLSGLLPPSISNCSKLRKLYMSANNFSGKLTINFANLRDIRHIILSDNHFGSEEDDEMKFIDSLKNCSNLEKLTLHNCKFQGVLPRSIGNLSHQLNNLDLGKNQLHGTLSSSIGNLLGLETLNLEDNRFIGKIPSTIGMLQKLNVAVLIENQFSGPIHDSIGNLSSLIELYLYSNKLEGDIPSSLGNCHKLLLLSMSNNKLSGKIPKQLFQLSALSNGLDLSYNNLSGSLPSEVGDLKMLSVLYLSHNNLSGNIPTSLGHCTSLIQLSLTGNLFQGMVPPSLSSLGALELLDLSHNNLSGPIPSFLERFTLLQELNLSFNYFEGEVPMMGVFSNASAFSVSGNDRLCGGLVELKLPYCKETKKHKKGFPLFVIIILFISAIFTTLCFLYVWCKKKTEERPSQSSKKKQFLKISYNELVRATDGFSEANMIGEGEFSSVYKGALDVDDDDNRFVAIKVLHLQNRGAQKSFTRECEAWQNIRHRNLLKIITSVSSIDFQGNDFKALVYEFMPNGSLHDWLHSSTHASRLNLLQRINILVDVASALYYLHNCCLTPIVHCDLKPSNILLDDDMVAHVGDFGLARFLETNLYTNSSTGVKGTIGYAPPEYGMGSEMTSSGDVYSFGILLLEVMTGKKPTDDIFNDGLTLHKFASMALPDHVVDIIDGDAIVMQSTEAKATKMEECLIATVKIGVSCSMDSPPQRMSIEDVVNELKHILVKLENI